MGNETKEVEKNTHYSQREEIGQILFEIPEPVVQVHYILSQDNVVIPSLKPWGLKILKMPPNTRCGFKLFPTTFIQVGEWSYPLTKEQKGICKTMDGRFLFPNLATNLKHSFVCLTLPRELSTETQNEFEMLLLQLIQMPEFPVSTSIGTLDKMLSLQMCRHSYLVLPQSTQLDSVGILTNKFTIGMIAGAQVVSKGLTSAADVTSLMINRGSKFVRKQIPQNPLPRSAINELVSPRLLNGVIAAKSVTRGFMGISDFIVDQIGCVAEGFIKIAADSLRSDTKKIMKKVFNIDNTEADEILDRMLDMTHGAITSTALVYSAIDGAAFTIAHALTQNSLQILKHRYGEDAGEMIQDAVEAAGNIALIGMQGTGLTPCQLIRQTLKQTSKLFISRLENNKNNNTDDNSCIPCATKNTIRSSDNSDSDDNDNYDE